jgi:hypothetical protein
MNGENATLVTRKEVIDEIADDRIGFVAKLCHNPADECATARVPLQINRAVRRLTMDLLWILAQPWGRPGR